MALVADEGLGLFCGLSAMPKRSLLSEYSSRLTPQKVAHLLAGWHAQLAGETILKGESRVSLERAQRACFPNPICLLAGKEAARLRSGPDRASRPLPYRRPRPWACG
jgi:hypothetical protein